MTRLQACRPRIARAWVLALILALMRGSAAAQEQGPVRYTYEDRPSGALHLLVWPAVGKPRSTLILFHGGGWRHGAPRRFSQMCESLQTAGITCVSVEYSLAGGEGVIGEARAAVRWVRKSAALLSIDPSRIAVGGGSVGGYLAASTAVLEPKDDGLGKPNALVLLSPLLGPLPPGPSETLQDYIHEPLPPTLILHSVSDRLVPIDGSRAFVAVAKEKGSRAIDLVAVPGHDHGFFNRAGRNQGFSQARQRIADFLAALWPK